MENIIVHIFGLQNIVNNLDNQRPAEIFDYPIRTKKQEERKKGEIAGLLGIIAFINRK